MAVNGGDKQSLPKMRRHGPMNVAVETGKDENGDWVSSKANRHREC